MLKLKTPSSALVHSRAFMQAAGLVYTGDGDTSKCEECGIEISNWANDMDPLKIHAAKSPTCLYVLKIKKFSLPFTEFSSNGTENVNACNMIAGSLYETNSMEQSRQRTVSHWFHRTLPSCEQMIEAGFFSCNVADRLDLPNSQRLLSLDFKISCD